MDDDGLVLATMATTVGHSSPFKLDNALRMVGSRRLPDRCTGCALLQATALLFLLRVATGYEQCGTG